MLLACDPSVPSNADDSGVAGENGFTFLVGTTDYASGVLSRIDVGDSTSVIDLMPVAADVAVEVQGDDTFVLGRSSENTVRMYAGLELDAPLIEVSTGDGTNPQDVGRCGDTLVVSLLAEDHLALYDAGAGADAGTIDLSAWDDGDGSPEADGILPGPDGDLYVALGRLDTSTDWTSADGTGAILRVDCETLTVAEEWETGPNPGLSPFPGDDSRMVLRTGDYFDADWNMKLDGALAAFDPAAGTIEELVTEAAYGRNLGALVGDAEHAMLVTDDGYSWNIACVDLATWEVTETDAVDSFLSDGAWGPDGKAWMVYRPGFADNGAPQVSGLVAWDPATCTAADPVVTTLPPSSLALIP